MRFHRLTILTMVVVLLLGFAGCGPSGPSSDEAEQARRRAEEKLAQLKEAKAAKQSTEIKMDVAEDVLDQVGVAYQYDPINKPDPFRPYNPTLNLSLASSENPLLRYEVRYFKLVGIVHDPAGAQAIFEDPSGKAYTVRAGDLIGKNGGVIRAILNDAVVITETRISWRTEGTETVEMTVRLRPEEATS